ncbi:hypothetical protein AQUCO_00900866v1 [Aquilegia coerulea]|uniref:Uncharacterized protein n=1 Tax=Aquilegia coerulea TaxID=218851 RepID=A0A2G5EFR2_AQUCA|nr:hypothetical protein AQUCO_00900866v1 [Aquilegia coerulea]
MMHSCPSYRSILLSLSVINGLSMVFCSFYFAHLRIEAYMNGYFRDLPEEALNHLYKLVGVLFVQVLFYFLIDRLRNPFKPPQKATQITITDDAWKYLLVYPMCLFCIIFVVVEFIFYFH